MALRFGQMNKGRGVPVCHSGLAICQMGVLNIEIDLNSWKYVCIYIYIYMYYVYVILYIYIYIYMKFVYIYIYIYVDVYTQRHEVTHTDLDLTVDFVGQRHLLLLVL